MRPFSQSEWDSTGVTTATAVASLRSASQLTAIMTDAFACVGTNVDATGSRRTSDRNKRRNAIMFPRIACGTTSAMAGPTVIHILGAVWPVCRNGSQISPLHQRDAPMKARAEGEKHIELASLELALTGDLVDEDGDRPRAGV